MSVVVSTAARMSVVVSVARARRSLHGGVWCLGGRPWRAEPAAHRLHLHNEPRYGAAEEVLRVAQEPRRLGHSALQRVAADNPERHCGGREAHGKGSRRGRV